MKRVKKMGMEQIVLGTLAGVLVASLHPAIVRADSTEEIINLLKAKNIITAEEAAQIIERHKEQEAQPQPNAKPVTIVLPKGQRYPKATADPVAKDIKEEVARQVKQELKDEIAKEVKREATAASALDWSKRIRFGGDVRLRYQDDAFGDDNPTVFALPSDPTKVVNRTVDRERLQYQARISANAQVNEQAEVGLRLATGNDGNPISTNDTLGDYMTKDSITFDQAYLKWTPMADASTLPGKLDLWGGRMPNPFLATDLVWDSDLNFEGVAANLEIPLKTGLKGFVNVGAFPLQEVDFSSQDKWLYGGQMGVRYTTRSHVSYTLAAAYYDYQDIQGVRNPYVIDGEGPYDYTAPLFQQTGNTVFNINQFNTGSELMALAADYNELNVTGKIDIGTFDPVYISFLGDYVKNLGFDRNEVNALTGVLVPKDDTGYLVGVTVGHQKMQQLWDWQTSLSYKYLEADAVLDAFTDSDFHLGGTNAKGWILGGQLGLGKDLWLRARWLSSDTISERPVAIDTLQVDLNARF